MVTNDRQSAQLASTLAWIEDNLRDSKSSFSRLAQQIEQTQSQVWDLAHRLHRAEEMASALANELGGVPALETQLTSIGDRIMRSESQLGATEARLGEAVREHQLEIEHLRSDVNEIVKRLDAWDRLTQHWAPRFEMLEEGVRKAHDATSVVRQRVDEFERFVELVDQRAARTADGMKRYEQDLLRLGAELEALHKQDEAAAERIQVYAEILKRLDDEIALVAQQVDVRREFNEKLDVQRSAVRRTEERLNAIEAGEDEVRQHLDEHAHALATLDSRERLFRERITSLQEELAAYRGHVAEQFQKVQSAVEKQKRRRIEEIEREIRELKVNGYRPQDE